jgi:hypothetical protein
MPNKFTDIASRVQTDDINELRAIVNLLCPPGSPLEQEVVEVFDQLHAAQAALEKLLDKIEGRDPQRPQRQ